MVIAQYVCSNVEMRISISAIRFEMSAVCPIIPCIDKDQALARQPRHGYVT